MPLSQDAANLFDLQVNGFAGVDFQSDELSRKDLRRAVAGLRRHQTGSILLTLVTDAVDVLCRRFERIEAIRRSDEDVAAVICGYHLEGPWISTETGFHGAHSVDLAASPTQADYRRIRDATGGNLRLITLAPEVEGCIEIIEAATADGIRVSLGHTNASERDIDDAIRAGATLSTHVGNATPEMLHRHDNVVQRLLARDELVACLIPDGIHLPPFVLKNFFRAKCSLHAASGPGTPDADPVYPPVFFTTDCMSAAGAGPGRFTIGRHTVDVGNDGIVHLPGDRRFAGSSLTMDRALENAIRWLDLDAEAAVAMCSTLPAEHFGLLHNA